MYGCPARISQRSNLKYIKTVMDNLNDRLRVDFHDSCLGFLADVPEIQFFAQLIHTLVCRGICCDKSHELWFNVQGHLTRFGLQEYAIVTGLHAGSFPEGDRYIKALEKRRLKEKYFISLEKISCVQLEKAFLCASTPRADRYKLRLTLIVKDIRPCLHSVWTDINATFLLLSSGQIWAYEAMPELDERFDDLVRSVVGPQFHEATPASVGDDGSAAGDEHDDESGAGVEDNETSASDDH
ncbi:Hypothetical predicted protein [Olea europaea subsp. europaea]|uniref:DUF1985 domain-containing protein n=1 Tax=Olea europaea subsp. europaea TaxID=158383 RepID=A0A8S0QVR9_OLEEU|nr:Hypothetical predicted protein [Olea europaea subsp. europaea]